MSSAYLVTVTYIWYIFIKMCDYNYTLCNKGNSNGNMKLFVLTCNLCTFRSRCSCKLRTLTAISVDPVSWLKGLSAEKCRRVTSEACMLIRWTSALCRLLSHTTNSGLRSYRSRNTSSLQTLPPQPHRATAQFRSFPSTCSEPSEQYSTSLSGIHITRRKGVELHSHQLVPVRTVTLTVTVSQLLLFGCSFTKFILNFKNANEQHCQV